MKQTNVSSSVLSRLSDELSELTPEVRKAATYVLENPRDVGVSTVREIAEAANVKPNTVVRMARQVGVYTLGVGVNHSNASNFTYLASTGMVQFHAIPRPASTATDDLTYASKDDVLIAITCKPYRSEVVEAVRIAKSQGLTIVSISDSPASPIIREADHGFLVATDTPQFFPFRYV